MGIFSRITCRASLSIWHYDSQYSCLIIFKKSINISLAFLHLLDERVEDMNEFTLLCDVGGIIPRFFTQRRHNFNVGSVRGFLAIPEGSAELLKSVLAPWMVWQIHHNPIP